MEQQYLLEMSRFGLGGECTNYEQILSRHPKDLVQLSFWCEVMIITKIKIDDVPDSAVFYLHDLSYD